MLLIICVERLIHIGSHFSLRKWRRWPHFPTKIGGSGLILNIFLQNWRRRQGFGNITGGFSDMVWILVQLVFSEPNFHERIFIFIQAYS